MGICTLCGYLSAEGENHACQPEKVNLMKGMAKLLYDVIVYADPASTAPQKADALTRIQNKRSWIEANAAKLNDFLV